MGPIYFNFMLEDFMSRTYLLIDFDDFEPESGYLEWGHITQTSKEKLVEIMGSEKEARELYESMKNSTRTINFHTKPQTAGKDGGIIDRSSSIREIIGEEFKSFTESLDRNERLIEEEVEKIYARFDAKPLDEEKLESLWENIPTPNSLEEELAILKQVFQIENMEDRRANKFIRTLRKALFDEKTAEYLKSLSELHNPNLKIAIINDEGSYYGEAILKGKCPELFKSPNIVPVLADDCEEHEVAELAAEYLLKSVKLQAGDTVIFANRYTSSDIEKLAEELHNKFNNITIKTVGGLTGPALVELAQELAELAAPNDEIYQYSAKIKTYYSPSTDMVGAIAEGNHESVNTESADTVGVVVSENYESVDAKSADTSFETNTTEMFPDLSAEISDSVSTAISA
jgi:hypothetical protein